MIRRVRRPVICETYLGGGDLSVGILGTGDAARIVGVMEISVRPDVTDRIYSFENKELCEERVIYKLADDEPARAAQAISPWPATAPSSAATPAGVDLKLDAAGVPQFLD